MGGGRRKFLTANEKDYQENKFGDRVDNRSLIEEWQTKMQSKNKKYKFVWNRTEFDALKPNQYDHVLALLNYDHMEFETERSISQKEPSIKEMTKKAIELLSTNPNGYFLLVEGGKIDHGHHAANARRALDDFVAFDEAIGLAKQLVSLEDTLVIVTADHSHV
jgi:alkaline phosphatase